MVDEPWTQGVGGGLVCRIPVQSHNFLSPALPYRAESTETGF